MDRAIQLKDFPEVRRLIQAADPSYKRHTAMVFVRDRITLNDTFWDSGTRYTYTAVHILTKRAGGAPQYDPPQFGGPREAPTVSIPEGVAIVKTGTFCGKTAEAYVYVQEANLTKLLP